jgi:hypothetical protein
MQKFEVSFEVHERAISSITEKDLRDEVRDLLSFTAMNYRNLIVKKKEIRRTEEMEKKSTWDNRHRNMLKSKATSEIRRT